MPSPTIFTTFANLLSGKSEVEKCPESDLTCQITQAQQAVDFFIRDAQINLHTDLTKNFTCQVPWVPNADIFASNAGINIKLDIHNNEMTNPTPFAMNNIYIDGPFTFNLRDPKITIDRGNIYLQADNDGDPYTTILNEKLPGWLKDAQEKLPSNIKTIILSFIAHKQINKWLIEHGFLLSPDKKTSLDEIVAKISSLCRVQDSNDPIHITNNLFNNTQFTLDLKDLAYVIIPGGLDLTESKLKINVGFNQSRIDIFKQPYIHIEDFLIHLQPDATSTTPPNAALPLSVTIKPSATTRVIGDEPNPLFILNPGIHIKFIPLRNTWQINAAVDIEIKFKNMILITTFVINAEFFMLGDEIYAEKDHLFIALKDSQIYDKNYNPLATNLNLELTDNALLGYTSRNYPMVSAEQHPGANLFANIYTEVDFVENPDIVAPPYKIQKDIIETEHIFGLLTAAIPTTTLSENGGFAHQAWKLKDVMGATIFGNLIYEGINHYLSTQIQFTPFNSNLETSPIGNYSHANLHSLYADIEYHNLATNFDFFLNGLAAHVGLASNGTDDSSYSITLYNDQLTINNLIPPLVVADKAATKKNPAEVNHLSLNNIGLSLLINSVNVDTDHIKIVLNQAEMSANSKSETTGLLQGPLNLRVSKPEGEPLVVDLNTKQKVLNFSDLDMALSVQGFQPAALLKYGIYAGFDAKLSGSCNDFNYDPNIFKGACELHLTSNEKPVYDADGKIKLQYDYLGRPYAVVASTSNNRAYNPQEGVVYFTNQDGSLAAPPIISYIDWKSEKIDGLGKIKLHDKNGDEKEYFTGWMDGIFNATILGSTLALERIEKQFNMFINFNFPHTRLYLPIPVFFPRAVGVRAQLYYEAVTEEKTGTKLRMEDIYRQFIPMEDTP